jgi:hypothetical protein
MNPVKLPKLNSIIRIIARRAGDMAISDSWYNKPLYVVAHAGYALNLVRVRFCKYEDELIFRNDQAQRDMCPLSRGVMDMRAITWEYYNEPT